MAGCSNCGKPSVSCSGGNLYAPCVYWEISDEELQAYITGGSSTDLTECVDLDSALTEIYTKIKNLEEATDFSDWKSECLTLTEDEPTLIGVVTDLDAALCDLKETVEDMTFCNLLDQEINDCIDVSCLEALEDVCANPLGVTTWKELLVALTNKVCELAA